MPAKKKPVRNGFYFFMQDMLPVLRSQGYEIRGMAEVVPLAHPKWKQLEPREKERYEQMAKDWKKEQSKMDCRGIPITHLMKRKEEEDRKRDAMIKEITSTVDRLQAQDGIKTDLFYIISFNICIKTDEEEDPSFWPCEVGIVRFSLQCGVDGVYQKFIDPGTLPPGYAAQAKLTSETTHQIPYKNFDLAEDNHRKTVDEIVTFISKGGKSNPYPPLYCKQDEMEMTEKCLYWLYDSAGEDIPNWLRVYSVDYLYFTLSQAAGKKNVPLARCSGDLERSTFDYHQNIACSWHENVDEPKWCAQAMSKRRAYIICDMLGNEFGIALEKGLHLPEEETGSYSQTQLNIARRQAEDQEERISGQQWQEVTYRHPTSEWTQKDVAGSSESSQPLRRPTTTGFASQTSSEPPALDDDNFPSLGGGAAAMTSLGLHIGRGRMLSPGASLPMEQPAAAQTLHSAGIGRGRGRIGVADDRDRGVGGALAAQFRRINMNK